MEDHDELSDGDSEGSGFEESKDQLDRDKERCLENDKYDLALEVSASASMDDEDLESSKDSLKIKSKRPSSEGSKDGTAADRLGVGKSGDTSLKAIARERSLEASRKLGGDEKKTEQDVKNDQFDAAYDLSSADDESSVDTSKAAERKGPKKLMIGAPTASERRTFPSSVTGTATSGAVRSAVAGLSSSAIRSGAAGSGVGSDGSESGSESSSNEDDQSNVLKVEGAYDPADYAELKISTEIKDLFQYIGRYKAHGVDLDTSLRCFVPDFIPAVGDTDAFLKVPRPDDNPDELGFKVLDEPAANQSDATVLELQLRAISKKQHGDVAVRSIENAHKNPAEIDRWIQSIDDLHRTKPPQQVNYKNIMPDIDRLMEVWPPEVEEAIENVKDLSPEIDLSLEDYARMMCAVMDIPVYDNIIESLHVLFTTFMEFKNNAHFTQLGAVGASRIKESTDFSYK